MSRCRGCDHPIRIIGVVSFKCPFERLCSYFIIVSFVILGIFQFLIVFGGNTIALTVIIVVLCFIYSSILFECNSMRIATAITLIEAIV